MHIILFVIAAGFSLTACVRDSFVEQRIFAMGTWVDLVYRSVDPSADAAVAVSIEAALREFEVDYYAWADGELALLNEALANGRAYAPAPDMQALLRRAQRMSELSDGFFDPGVGALVEAWGFHSSLTTAAELTPDSIQAWLRDRPSIAGLRIDGANLSSLNPQLLIDLGGIAKGEAVDRIVALLGEAGISDALVNAGGDVRAVGRRDERPWRVGIQAPRSAGLLGSIALQSGEAVFTSGDYERYFETDGTRRHHLLDPTTGYPATHTQAVTVIAKNGASADAAATALFIAGPANWRRIAEQLEISAVLRVDASGEVEMTPQMRARVDLQEDAETATIVGQS